MAIQLSTEGGDEDAPIMDINTTPLIDVMLVLLVMLIITIPIQLHAVDLRLPPPGAVPPPLKPEVVRIEIDAAQTVRWNGEPLADAAELDRRFLEAAARSPQPVIELRPEAQARYRTVARVMVGADRAGLQALGVAALP